MIIKEMVVENFRNIKHGSFQFHVGVNVFCGKNAQGKTNLMEAISICIGTSFRKSKFSQYIPFDNNEGEPVKITIKYIDESNENKINNIEYIILKNKRVIKHNDIPIKDALKLYGMLKYVVFTPEHLELIKGSPEQRRDYLDEVAIMQTAVHNKKVSRYQRALRNKNNILSSLPNSFDKDIVKLQLESWNEVLATEGINVTFGRLKYFNLLKDIAADYYAQLTDNNEVLSLKYNSTIFQSDDIDFSDKESLFTHYKKILNDDFEQEIKQRHTISGVHRDDLVFYINGANAREFASQGQKRSIALVLKLAEAEIIRKRGFLPIMILDDVLSELDSVRRNFVLNNIENSQVFITSCNKQDLCGLKCGKLWNVSKGKFNLIEK